MNDFNTVVVSALAGLFSGLVTAYITTNLKIKQEKRKWDREFAIKYLEAKSSGKSYKAQDLASQYALGYLLVVEAEEGLATASPRKIFIPRNCRLLAGRGDDNDIHLNNIDISRKHIMFTADENDVWVEDLATSIGVLITTNKESRKLLGAHKLRVGDILKIGSYVIEYRDLEKNI